MVPQQLPPAPSLVPRRPQVAFARSYKEWWYCAAVLLVWLTSLAAVYIWVRNAGIQDLFEGRSSFLVSLGRICGIVASNLLLYQVLFMARVPLLERGFGRDGITRFHRQAGFWSFWLMVAHIVFLTIAYSAMSQQNLWDELIEMVLEFPGMLLAAAGTLLLIMVVITSMRFARRRLRYESWHLLHLYAYLGAGLALPHQLWTGADFLVSPLATVYWWTLWAVAAGCVLIFRVGLPIARSMHHQLRVSDVWSDGPHAITLRMTGRDLAGLKTDAGQFFVFRFLDGPGWTRGHPFSVSQAPSGNDLVITVKVVGDGTMRMRNLQPGTKVLIEGPYGVMTPQTHTRESLSMFACGAGVAPLVSLLQAIDWKPGQAVLVTRDHDANDALLTSTLSDLVTTRGLQWYQLLGGRSYGPSPWVPATDPPIDGSALIEQVVPNVRQSDVYLCGPQEWMSAVEKDLKKVGVKRKAVHCEAFA